MNKTVRLNDINLGEIAIACLKKWKQICLATVVCGMAAFLVTKICITPLYTSTVQIYVNNSDITTSSSSVSTSDLNASAQLVDLYEVILNTDDTLDLILEHTGLTYSYSALKSMISTSAVNDTQVFKVSVSNASPEEAQLIASTIGDVLPGVITDIVRDADAVVVSHAKIPTSISSPNYFKNTFMGAFAGFIIAILAIIAINLMDITIHTEREIQEITKKPILAYIPDFDIQAEQKYEYSKYGKRK